MGGRPGIRHALGWRTLGRLVVLALGGLLVWATLTAQGRTYARSLLFIPSLIPGAPVRPINHFTRTPSRVHVSFSDGPETWTGRLYLPATPPPHPGIVVALGVNQAGLDDPRVARLGEGLARMGVAALVPHSETLAQKRLTRREIDFTVAAFQFLERRTEVDPRRVGFLGVCVGSSLALLAAGDTRIAERVSFVNWFGGYYRLEDLIVSVATHTYEDAGRRVPWTPDPLTAEVVKRSVIEFVEDEEERRVLRDAILGGRTLTEDEAGGLSPTGSMVHRLFGSTPEEARRLLVAAPQPARDVLRDLSPATRLDRVKARVYVMEDRGDGLIPFVESVALANDLGSRLARHSQFSVFSHVDLDRLANPVRSAPQLWRLFLHVHAIFRAIG